MRERRERGAVHNSQAKPQKKPCLCSQTSIATTDMHLHVSYDNPAHERSQNTDQKKIANTNQREKKRTASREILLPCVYLSISNVSSTTFIISNKFVSIIYFVIFVDYLCLDQGRVCTSMSTTLDKDFDEFVDWKRSKHAKRVAQTQFRAETVPLIDQESFEARLVLNLFLFFFPLSSFSFCRFV